MLGPTVLLLGGGYVLSRLANELEQGSFVITSRDLTKIEDWRKKHYFAELCDTAIPDQISTIFEKHTAIDTVIDSIPPFSGEKDKTLGGVENTCLSVNKSKAKRFFYLSTTGVFGISDGSWVDESTCCNPVSKKAVARLDSENYYRNHLDSSIALTTFRLPAIYGPNRGLGIAIRSGRFLIPPVERFSNRIHVADLVEILSASIRSSHLLPPILCVSDDLPAPYDQVIEHYCNTFSFPKPEIASETQWLSERMDHFRANAKVSNSLVKKTLGIELKYPSFKHGAGTEFSN
ncbi:MAG: NAD-dependent epimerase/dehydratase family protein [Bdellovibrionales bacterium]|nr:NAD-dependent epimerase/dehydratase family protein [Bdellovibrionales bacterium]